MGLQRPAWTLCFCFIAILLVPAALLTHMSLGKLIPAIGDLPSNLNKGFDEVFKFKYLSQDSDNLKLESSKVITKCKYSAPVICPKIGNPISMVLLGQINKQGSVNTEAEKKAIDDIFGRSLDSIGKVANDKYLGTEKLQSTNDNLKQVRTDFEKIRTPTMQCGPAVAAFCKIYDNAGKLKDGVGQVNSEIDKFKDGDMVKRWEKNKGILTFLHALPYLMVFAVLCYGFFIWKGGVCCCCREGTVCGSLANIPFLIFWFISFLIYLIVLATGCIIRFAANRITIDQLKGKPSLDEVTTHIMEAFPEFWELCFKTLVEGLELLFASSWFFVLVAILIAIYAGCQCCCCPYRKKADAAEAAV